jgi:hypothetical protein
MVVDSRLAAERPVLVAVAALLCAYHTATGTPLPHSTPAQPPATASTAAAHGFNTSPASAVAAVAAGPSLACTEELPASPARKVAATRAAMRAQGPPAAAAAAAAEDSAECGCGSPLRTPQQQQQSLAQYASPPHGAQAHTHTNALLCLRGGDCLHGAWLSRLAAAARLPSLVHLLSLCLFSFSLSLLLICLSADFIPARRTRPVHVAHILPPCLRVCSPPVRPLAALWSPRRCRRPNPWCTCRERRLTTAAAFSGRKRVSVLTLLLLVLLDAFSMVPPRWPRHRNVLSAALVCRSSRQTARMSV